MPKTSTLQTLPLAFLICLAASNARAADPLSQSDQELIQSAEELPALSVPRAARVRSRDEERSLRDWYALGGWTMHGLVICSVLVVALVAERGWALRRSMVVPQKLLLRLVEIMDARRFDLGLEVCASSRSSLARISCAALRHLQDPGRVSIERVRSVGEAEVDGLHRNLATLVAIANLATLLGLLGTVLGMIDAFGSVAELGTGDARVVASGIFEALITTATGLTIGVAGIAAHTFLRRRTDQLGALLEQAVSELFDDFIASAVHEESPIEPVADWATSTG